MGVAMTAAGAHTNLLKIQADVRKQVAQANATSDEQIEVDKILATVESTGKTAASESAKKNLVKVVKVTGIAGALGAALYAIVNR
jgi:hypothetical protein